jgi:hypothetical protein
MGIDINPVEITDIKPEDNNDNSDIDNVSISNNICNKIRTLIKPSPEGLENLCQYIKDEMKITMNDKDILKNQLSEIDPNGIHFIFNTTDYITDPL